MIFYFTGTGNSLAAARALAAEGEPVIDITRAQEKGSFTYEVEPGEKVGFVYPEYCSSVCRPMVDFVRRVTLKNAKYVYAVITCASGKAKSAGYFAHLLAEHDISLSVWFSVMMPNNCLIYFPTQDGDKAAEVLREADAQLAQIKTELSKKALRNPGKWRAGAFSQNIVKIMGTTKPYRVTDKCIGCGQCAKNCPDHAIQMHGNRPVWVKKSCAKCTACINRCPAQAIEHGKGSAERQRYVHPILK